MFQHNSSSTKNSPVTPNHKFPQVPPLCEIIPEFTQTLRLQKTPKTSTPKCKSVKCRDLPNQRKESYHMSQIPECTRALDFEECNYTETQLKHNSSVTSQVQFHLYS